MNFFIFMKELEIFHEIKIDETVNFKREKMRLFAKLNK